MDEATLDAGFAEFEAAFADENQISDPVEENVEPEQKEQEGQEPPETGEPDTDESGSEPPENGTEGTEPPEEQPETFILRVNKEERTVNREEVISLAQKGADYDRVKGQLTESRAQVQQLQEQVDKNRETIDTLEMISKNVKMSVPDLVNQLHVNMLVKSGKTEAEAKAEIRAIKAEAKLNAAKAKETPQKETAETAAARAEREVAEFHKRFPGVELTKELCDELTKDVREGMSISDAYQKREIARKDAEIAELNRKLAAEKQNRKNKASTPGSQNDSGGRREKSDFDDFMSAFA